MNNLYNVDLKKLSELPKRAGWKHRVIRDSDYRNHSWYSTETYRRASAIVNNSVGMNINQVITKIKPLIPPQENLDYFLSWNYNWITLDHKVMDRHGRISEMPAPSRYGSYNSLYIQPDGYIIRINGGIRRHYSPIELARQHEAKLASRQKAKQIKADKELKAQILVYLINLPDSIKYRRWESDYGPIGPDYYRCLLNLFVGTYTEIYSFEAIKSFAEGIEQQYFEETGIKYKNGKRV